MPRNLAHIPFETIRRAQGPVFTRRGGSAELPDLDTLERWLDTRPAVQVAFGFIGPDGEHRLHEADPRLVPLWQGGLTTSVRHIEHHFDAVRSLCDTIGVELDATVSATAFLSSTGHGASLHQDATDALIFQLAGIKRWWLTQSSEAQPPLTTVIPDRREDLPRLTSLPDPRREQVLDLRPHDVLFVPAGCWHRTQAMSASYSLTLILRRDTVRDHLRRHLDRRLGTVPCGLATLIPA